MSQSRTMSAIETVANVGIGYGISVLTNMIVLPLFGFPVRASEAAAMGVIFTGVALVRSYCVRRIFARC